MAPEVEKSGKKYNYIIHDIKVIWQQHTYVLEKAPAFGFGIAVSGGVDNPAARTGDTSVIISDVVKGGPAWDKLQVTNFLNLF